MVDVDKQMIGQHRNIIHYGPAESTGLSEKKLVSPLV